MIKSYLQYIKEDLDNNLNYEKIEDIFLPLIEHCDWSIDYYNIYNLEMPDINSNSEDFIMSEIVLDTVRVGDNKIAYSFDLKSGSNSLQNDDPEFIKYTLSIK
jgi:hypothetical protein